MRKISQNAVNAFANQKNWANDNTMVRHDAVINETCLFLHGNLIAKKNSMGFHITNAGWASNTTKERLNAFDNVSIFQKKGQWYLNGQVWNGDWTTI